MKTLARFTYYPEEAQCLSAADDNPTPTRDSKEEPWLSAAADNSKLTSLDGAAFDRAVEAFHHAYAHAYKPSLPSEHDEAHQEAMQDALQTFLATYMEIAR